MRSKAGLGPRPSNTGRGVPSTVTAAKRLPRRQTAGAGVNQTHAVPPRGSQPGQETDWKNPSFQFFKHSQVATRPAGHKLLPLPPQLPLARSCSSSRHHHGARHPEGLTQRLHERPRKVSASGTFPASAPGQVKALAARQPALHGHVT